MNPCGKAVDIGRRPYTTKAKLVAGSNELFTLVWYKADPAAGTLPFPSAVSSLDWASDPTRPTPIGEVFGQSRKYNGKWRVLGADGSHVCGTADDFLNGCKPADPPREYLPNGLPKCCRPALKLGIGGLLLGGTCTVNVGSSYCSGYFVPASLHMVQLTPTTWGASGWTLEVDPLTSNWLLYNGGDINWTFGWDGHGTRVFTGPFGPTFSVSCEEV